MGLQKLFRQDKFHGAVIFFGNTLQSQLKLAESRGNFARNFGGFEVFGGKKKGTGRSLR